MISGYMTSAQAAEKWGLSSRRVVILCNEGRIPGAERIAYTWFIPNNAEKPADGRHERKGHSRKENTMDGENK